ncbi:MAG: glycosyltransferase family 1 protein [Eggerthellaceae bacterium]|nr:glycosyltransferase family 1 protein [Eggerthellaceae bacterium]
MRILIVPMFALSPMNGPWMRTQAIARAFLAAGHDVAIARAADGNCYHPASPKVLTLPAPSPLGLPMAIASRTFPIATKLGIAGRKPVKSFEEVLWLTGNLSYSYTTKCVNMLRAYIQSKQIDVIYSEFNLAAIIAAKAEGIPVVGSVSYPTQAAYANAKRKAQGINRVLSEVGLPRAGTALNLFTWLDFRFVPSCYELEPMEGPNLAFCGFLDAIAPVQTPDSPTDGQRNVLVFYLGTGTVPRKRLYRAVCEIADAVSYELYVAGVDESDAPASAKNRKNLHFGKRFDFSELLPCAIAFVNHGGQNSVMTALEYGVPQIIYPGKVFERQYNAQSIVDAGAGISLADFTSESVSGAIEKLRCDTSLARNASALRETLSSLGGTSCIISHTEELVANRIVKKLFPQRISLD